MTLEDHHLHENDDNNDGYGDGDGDNDGDGDGDGDNIFTCVEESTVSSIDTELPLIISSLNLLTASSPL